MMYLIGYTQEEAEHWEGVFLGLTQRPPLNTQATSWGKIELTDGTWAVPVDPVRLEFVRDDPAVQILLTVNLPQREEQGRYKGRAELIELGLIVEPEPEAVPNE